MTPRTAVADPSSVHGVVGGAVRPLAIITLALHAALAACSDDRQAPTQLALDGEAISSEPVVGADPAVSSIPSSARAPSLGENVYVSLSAGAFPTGRLAVIKNLDTGGDLTRPIVDGGLDPVAVPASVGDRLEITVTGDQSMMVGSLAGSVPRSRRPRVVRTIPPRGKIGVPLNARLVMVFSEPVRQSSSTGIRLLRNGAPVSGSVTVTPDGLRAEFTPNAPLAPNTRYVLSATSAVVDMSGDALEADVDIEFTTGSAVALASIVTLEPALIINSLSSAVRTFEMDATLGSNGVFSGTFTVFYEQSGLRISGRVACFAIVDGRRAWAAGIVESAQDTDALGVHVGWRMMDNGPPTSGVPDQLSLIIDTDYNGLGSALDFCAEKPETGRVDGEISLSDLLSGDIAVAGVTPAPTTPPPAGNRLQFTGQPTNTGAGQVMLPGAEVTVRRPDGTVASDYVGSVSVAVEAASTGGTLPGLTRASVRNGVASFNLLTVGEPGSYRLIATADGVAAGRSNVFSILPSMPPSGRIAFAIGSCVDGDDTNCNDDLFIVNADGSGLTRLTSDPGFELSPTWSPDGQKLAFMKAQADNIGYCCVNSDIYVVNDDGSEATRLTTDGNSSNPVWSPDGTKIAFERNGEIYTMNADGSGVLMLTNNPLGWDNGASWSPDSRKIVFASQRSGSGRPCNFGDCIDYQIYIMNADGSGVTRLSNTAGQAVSPNWSPDGSKIIFIVPHTPRQLYVVRPDGSGPTLLPTTLEQIPVAWSPDGTRFVALRASSSEGIDRTTFELVSADGSGSSVLLTRIWPEYIGNVGHSWTAVGRQP